MTTFRLPLSRFLHLRARQLPPLPLAAPRAPAHHILIYDRSGSVYPVLPRIVATLQGWIDQVPAEDLLTVGWFSSPGERDFPLKGAAALPHLKPGYRAILERNNFALGTTCFSEIMGDLSTVLDDLGALSPHADLFFLTDGQPVVPDVRRELRAIETALTRIRPRLTSALFVGFGDWYRRDLMADMAHWAGGALVHSDDLPAFEQAFRQFTAGAIQSAPVIRLAPEEADRIALGFYFRSGDQWVVLPPTASEIVIPQAPGPQFLYALYDQEPEGEAETPPETGTLAAELARGQLAGAFALSQLGHTDEAIIVLRSIHQPDLATRLDNAFTVPEIGAAESAIAQASGAPARLVLSPTAPALSTAEPYSVLDVLEQLAADPECRFYPTDPHFQYKRIGRAAKVQEGYPVFVANPGVSSPLSDLVYHESRLNLSLRTRQEGTVRLPDDCAQVHLDPVFPTFVWRNYTIVRDGVLNVTTLPVTMSERTWDQLLHYAVVQGDWEPDRIVPLCLSGLPMVTRRMVNAPDLRSAVWVATQVNQILEWQARLKVVHAFLDEFDPEREARRPQTAWPVEIEQYLREHGITAAGYNPPTEAEPAHDVYFAKALEIKVKGFSSLPKVSEVWDKLAAGKKLTPSGELIAGQLRDLEPRAQVARRGGAHLARALSEFYDIERRTQRDLASARADLGRAKFTLLLSHGWFSEFKSRAENQLELNGRQFTFELRDDVRVDL